MAMLTNPPNVETLFPTEMQHLNHWLLWRLVAKEGQAKPSKVPYNPHTLAPCNPTELTQCGTFTEAVFSWHKMPQYFAGVGFSLQNTLVCVDLDNSLDAVGNPLPWVEPILAMLPPSFTEVSQSGKGLHWFGWGSLTGETGSKFTLACGHCVEIYHHKRFIAMTGNRFQNAPITLSNQRESIRHFYQWCEAQHQQQRANQQANNNPSASPLAPPVILTDLPEQMFNSRHGGAIKALWQGDVASYAGDDSSADLALLSHLAFWTKGDAVAMETLFGQSVLGQRSKWQSRADYRQRSIQKALNNTNTSNLSLTATVASPLANSSYSPTFSPQWEAPRVIQQQLLPVEAFDTDLLPLRAKAWLIDESHRMQVSIDFMAVTLMVMLGSLIGRQVGIRPKAQDSWLVVPNLWGMIIGKPSTMKTPSIQSVLKSVSDLEKRAFGKHQQAMKDYENLTTVMEIKRKALEQKLKASFKNGNVDMEKEAKQWEEETMMPPFPVCKRYMSNDPTIEKIGELLSQNPNGLLLFRDELAGFLKKLDKEGYESDRAFYLESWNGTGSYTFDRITRGTVYIAGHCLSVFGGIQPSVISKWLSDALTQTGKDDGLIQRFQLMVYPDTLQAITHVDAPPNLVAKQNFYSLIQELATITPQHLGCFTVADDSIPFLRFTEEAQPFFDDWHLSWRKAHLNGNENPTLEAHFTKYAS